MSNDPTKQNETSIGMNENVGAMISYIFIIGIVFLFLEKNNRFIRFHSFQSIFLAVATFLVTTILNVIPFIGWFINVIISPIILLLVIFMMYQAYQGKYYKLPFLGDLAEKQLP